MLQFCFKKLMDVALNQFHCMIYVCIAYHDLVVSKKVNHLAGNTIQFIEREKKSAKAKESAIKIATV